MRRTACSFLAALVSGCAVSAPVAEPRLAVGGALPANPDIAWEARERWGDAAVGALMSADSAVLVRRPVSFPGPPGPATIVGVMRSDGRWTRIDAAGAPRPLSPAVGQLLDRLLADPLLWSEPDPPSGCTDPAGIDVLVRHIGRESLTRHNCSLDGVSGELAQTTLSGRITDWTRVPADLRPSGLPLTRFEGPTQNRFRFMSGLYAPRNLVIRSEAEWRGQWMRLLRRQDPPPLPPVDFGREMLLMAAMGPQPTGGHEVRIEQAIESEDELFVFVRFLHPGPTCGAIQAVTSPVDIVRLARSDKPVRWSVEESVSDCP